jgi:cell division protein FtsB
MSSGLIATIIVFLLVCLFGLMIFYDRKKITKEETAAKSVTETYMSPKERWEAHVKELRRRQKSL